VLYEEIADEDHEDLEFEDEIPEVRSYDVWEDEDVLLEIPSVEARFRQELLRT
jgi:hypothetical protein